MSAPASWYDQIDFTAEPREGWAPHLTQDDTRVLGRESDGAVLAVVTLGCWVRTWYHTLGRVRDEALPAHLRAPAPDAWKGAALVAEKLLEVAGEPPGAGPVSRRTRELLFRLPDEALALLRALMLPGEPGWLLDEHGKLQGTDQGATTVRGRTATLPANPALILRAAEAKLASAGHQHATWRLDPYWAEVSWGTLRPAPRDASGWVEAEPCGKVGMPHHHPGRSHGACDKQRWMALGVLVRVYVTLGELPPEAAEGLSTRARIDKPVRRRRRGAG